MDELLNIGVALVAGAAAKKIGQSGRVGGTRPWHKVLAPAAALGVGIVASAVTGGDVPMMTVLQDGGTAGAAAIAAHSTVKNVAQLIRLLRG